MKKIVDIIKEEIGLLEFADSLSGTRLNMVRRVIKKIDPSLDIQVDHGGGWKSYWLIDKSKKLISTQFPDMVSYELIRSFYDDYHSPIGRYNEEDFNKMLKYFQDWATKYIQNGRKLD